MSSAKKPLGDSSGIVGGLFGDMPVTQVAWCKIAVTQSPNKILEPLRRGLGSVDWNGAAGGKAPEAV